MNDLLRYKGEFLFLSCLFARGVLIVVVGDVSLGRDLRGASKTFSSLSSGFPWWWFGVWSWYGRCCGFL